MEPAERTPAASAFDRALDQVLERSLERYIGVLRSALQIPTPRRQEQQMLSFLGELLEANGVAPRLFPGDPGSPSDPWPEALNLFALRRGAGGGRSLLLQAHADVVPIGDPDRWSASPWSGEIRDGRIYARGAHDDRSGSVIVCLAADLLRQLSLSTRGDVGFLLTTEEEAFCGGMKAYLRQPDVLRPDGHLMIDGNRSNGCIVGHAGTFGYEIVCEGSWGSAQNKNNVHRANPIEHLGALVRKLKWWEASLRKRVADSRADPRWPDPIVAVTEMVSEGWITNVPRRAVCRGYVTVIPPLDLKTCQDEFERMVAEFGASQAWLRSRPLRLHWTHAIPPLEGVEGGTFHRLLSEAHRRATGAELEARIIGGWGDPRLLACPNTIFYGPGGGGGDHDYNEYYELRDLVPTLKTILHLIRAWCGVPA